MGLENCLGVRCRLVALARVTAKNVFLHERGHLGPPIVTLNEFERAVFARVSSSGRVVTGFHDLATKFRVVGDVQFAFVIQQTVEFFPLEYAVGETSRAFLFQGDEGVSDFGFAVGAIAYALFEGWGLSESGRGDCLKVFGPKNNLIVVVFSVSDLMFGKAREGIRTGLSFSRFVD